MKRPGRFTGRRLGAAAALTMAAVLGGLALTPTAFAGPARQAAVAESSTAHARPQTSTYRGLSISDLRAMQSGLIRPKVAGSGNIVNQASGRCIGISVGLAGDWDCASNADQQYYYADYFVDSNGITWANLRNGNGQCLAVSGGSTAAGARIAIWDCVGSADQYWLVQYNQFTHLINFNGYYSTAHPGEGADVVGVAGGSTANGAPLVLWTWVDAANQYWDVEQ